MSSVTFHYRWDKPTYLQAAKVAYDYEFKNSKNRYIGFFFIALTQFGVVALLKNGAPGLLFLSTFFVLYWYLLRWEIRKISIQRAFDRLHNSDQEYTIVANQDAITINTQQIHWSEVDKIVALDEGCLLYVADTFFFFPQKSFQNENEYELFKMLSKKYAQQYIDG